MFQVALRNIRPLVLAFTSKTNATSLKTTQRMLHYTTCVHNVGPKIGDPIPPSERNLSPDSTVSKWFNFQVISIIVAGMGIAYFYINYLAKYDLEVEELNMANIPDYEKIMNREVKGYKETIEKLRQKRANGSWVFMDFLK